MVVYEPQIAQRVDGTWAVRLVVDGRPTYTVHTTATAWGARRLARRWIRRRQQSERRYNLNQGLDWRDPS